MAGHCCEARFDGASARYKRILMVVIAINAIMFAVEFTAGHHAASQALQADSLDFLGDSITYSLSLVVIGMAPVWRIRAALAKGILLGLTGTFVVITTVHRALGDSVPEPAVMGAVGLIALLANLVCVMLLLRYRDGDANVRSVWLCSRNDAIGNVAVVLAASGVWGTAAAWPDWLVAGIMATLFVSSAVSIIRQALGERRDLAVAPQGL